jgi:hypothetical protein
MRAAAGPDCDGADDDADRQEHGQANAKARRLPALARREHDVLPRADAFLTVQNFVSAASGIVLAPTRGFARVRQYHRQLLGRRDAVHALHPAADLRRLWAVPGLASLPQTLGVYVDATTLEGAKQTLAVGPMGSQVAIKMLGTNGGGFFNANAAHPFDLVFMLLLPALSHLDQLNALAIVARKLRDQTV